MTTISNPPSYTLTAESVTIIWKGKPYTVKQGSPNYTGLKKAIDNKDWDKIPDHLTIAKSISSWSTGEFKIKDNAVIYKNSELPGELSRRIIETASTGGDPDPFYKFWAKLQTNPSRRSVEQLWPFLQHQGIPLTKDGDFLAYKGVTDKYMDIHSGTISNKPGTTVEIPRNTVSDDPREACHFGLHAGAKEYASSFSNGGKIIICKINPADVVCVPYDSSQQKMRVCKYVVIGEDGELSSTVQDDTDIDGVGMEHSYKEIEVEEIQQKDKDVKAKVTRRTKSSYSSLSKFNNLKTDKLILLSIEDLRKYATHILSIVGASKIPGGKTALIKKIMKARK